MCKHEIDIKAIENRFLEVAGLEGDLSIYPLTEATHLQVKTNKEKSNEFGEVFTPLWLVDKMVEQVTTSWTSNKTTLDMCAGYGQFTVRMIRKKYEVCKKNKEKFDLNKFLYETHSFNELQISSCIKLVYIFGDKINLFIGDSRKLVELDEDDKGIMYYSPSQNKWIDISETFLSMCVDAKHGGLKIDKAFEDDFDNYILNKLQSPLESFMVW